MLLMLTGLLGRMYIIVKVTAALGTHHALATPGICVNLAILSTPLIPLIPTPTARHCSPYLQSIAITI